ncbi:flagellar protein FliT [Caballeronia zhejiangensis]|uniref:Flagellar protein FliT n=1 Tax=Caballeronia zhejiangensis TaxID=871203 RepID=A0A656QT14_9BURK|nr:flagellar protein FliT [Caballeronia zhejiangensis]KDR32909.1 flagellar protein FliT [Caballeronia zhejiangensis]MCG7399573.1 flagellar protein FliT [Caballeronia zhejiangensis]MCI1041905.1 flagellar protein FliT [Caballeronia zhejiangensis]
MNQQEAIQNAWALTEAIEAAVSQNDWARAAELDAARAPLVMSLQGNQPAEALAVIKQVQASMEAVAARAKDAQAALSTTYRRSMDGAKAVSRYHQAARF